MTSSTNTAEDHRRAAIAPKPVSESQDTVGENGSKADGLPAQIDPKVKGSVRLRRGS